jgi:hypothetical protein
MNNNITTTTNQPSEKTLLWKEVIAALAMNPRAIVACPECREGKLIVKKVRFSGRARDYTIHCKSCDDYSTYIVIGKEQTPEIKTRHLRRRLLMRKK